MSDVVFPIVGCGQSRMATVRCDCLHPKDYPAGRALVLARDEQEIERILADARATETIGAEIARPIWVRFTPQQFSGRSYGLALALADKLARYRSGREADRGRVFATGTIVQDGSGRIGAVDGFEEKLTAIAEEAEPGDVVILPSANVETADQTVLAALALLTSKQVKWHSIDHLSVFEDYWIGGGETDLVEDDRCATSMETDNGHPSDDSAKSDAGITTSSRMRSSIKPWHLGAVMIISALLFLFWPLNLADQHNGFQPRPFAGENDGQDRTAFEKACEGGDLAGCAELGQAYRNGRGVDQDLDRAEAALIEACDGHDASGCAYLDRLYREVLGGEHRFQKAAALFQKACDTGFAWGCSHYGRLHRDGLGVERDFDVASVAFQRACEGGDPPACSHLGILYRDGKGVGQDGKRAQALFRQACDGGFARGCTNLGLLQGKS